jgi:hypothetical protein
MHNSISKTTGPYDRIAVTSSRVEFGKDHLPHVSLTVYSGFNPSPPARLFRAYLSTLN